MSQSDLGYGFAVAAFVAVTYDWALTFGQEVELIWRQRWSLMTVMYLSVRYLGALSAALSMADGVPTISLTDTPTNGRHAVLPKMLDDVHYMELDGCCGICDAVGKILIFLVVTFLAINTFDGVNVVLITMRTSGEELILSGTYQCTIGYTGDTVVMDSTAWVLSIVWEVLTLCLAVCIAVKHFRELRQHSAGGIIGDCFTVLMKTHVVYFASFVTVSCFSLILEFSPTVSSNQVLLEYQTFFGLFQVLEVVQTFVLGPRLILGVREYNAKLVAHSDAATGMTSIAFHERVHISTGSGV
ncbi:uncharacterized protein HD556DRAFT_1440450 [Suillus plorans]|uniref:DUF6533 domain-containing protein n=1 Tax=Suillus plorans TaxID=116603 RepID=A0A9P7IZ61_9AGAM|nr:uncharacterized protein HD556DRAFT_1440450 [Suillus plorans]KAG1798116.1 hypothetical protein HD556DRAFT_1440450 [Suillus plorans]